jgi:hypothetical protein
VRGEFYYFEKLLEEMFGGRYNQFHPSQNGQKLTSPDKQALTRAVNFRFGAIMVSSL